MADLLHERAVVHVRFDGAATTSRSTTSISGPARTTLRSSERSLAISKWPRRSCAIMSSIGTRPAT